MIWVLLAWWIVGVVLVLVSELHEAGRVSALFLIFVCVVGWVAGPIALLGLGLIWLVKQFINLCDKLHKITVIGKPYQEEDERG